MYAVVLGFEEKIERELKELVKKMKEELEIEYSDCLDGKLPHITLCAYDKIEKDIWIKEVEEYFSRIPAFEVKLESVGVFLGCGTIYLSPIMNESLYEVHRGYVELFKKYKMGQYYYEKDYWVPHCTLLNKVSQEDLMKSFQYAIEHIRPIKAKVNRALITELLIEEKKYVGIQVLKEIYLKEE